MNPVVVEDFFKQIANFVLFNLCRSLAAVTLCCNIFFFKSPCYSSFVLPSSELQNTKRLFGFISLKGNQVKIPMVNFNFAVKSQIMSVAHCKFLQCYFTECYFN